MPNRRIVVIGASAGGVESLVGLVGNLPGGLAAAVFVVLHMPTGVVSHLPTILSRAGPLPAVQIRNQTQIRAGIIRVAEPDHHVVIEPGRAISLRGPRENGHRPAIDPMFRSAALAYGPEVAAVVLSGVLDDGTAGLAVVRQHGGMTLVQDPREALFPGMPAVAIESVEVDYVLPVREIAATLADIVGLGDVSFAE